MDYLNICIGDDDVGVPVLISCKSLLIDEIQVSLTDDLAERDRDCKIYTSESTDFDGNLHPIEKTTAECNGDSLQRHANDTSLCSSALDGNEVDGNGDRRRPRPQQQETEIIYCSIEQEHPNSAIGFEEAIQNLGRWQIILNHSHLIIQEDAEKPSFFKTLINFIFGPAKLSEDLQEERDYALCLSKVSFCNSSELHSRILQTIHRSLTGSSGCPRFGEHWEEIGFQGVDPATDLRSGGLLSLLHILHFVSDERSALLACEIFQLSRDEEMEFPFCAVGINLTVTCLKVMKRGAMNKEFNSRKEVLGPLNRLYCSLFYKFYTAWKQSKKSIVECNATLESVEASALRRPYRIMTAYDKRLSTL